MCWRDATCLDCYSGSSEEVGITGIHNCRADRRSLSMLSMRRGFDDGGVNFLGVEGIFGGVNDKYLKVPLSAPFSVTTTRICGVAFLCFVGSSSCPSGFGTLQCQSASLHEPA